MNQTISNKDWVEYSLGGIRLIGFVEDAGNRVYWFSDPDILTRDGRCFIVDDTEIRVLPLEIHREDIEAMIDLALQTGDKEWFNELTQAIYIVSD